MAGSGKAAGGMAAGGMAAGGAEADREAGTLRGAMAGQIAGRYHALFPGQRELGEGLPGSVAAALRKVPRHLFTPGVPLARAYEDDAVVLPQRARPEQAPQHNRAVLARTRPVSKQRRMIIV